jgi:hypothetical protein
MPIAAYFHPNGMTIAQFEEAHRRLDAAGAGHPRGQIHHSCFGADGDLMVYDVWESPEAFEAFGTQLRPIAADVGIELGEPAILPLHRLEQVERETVG